MPAKRTERQERHLKELRTQTLTSARTATQKQQKVPISFGSKLVDQVQDDPRYERLQKHQKQAAVCYAEGVADGVALLKNAHKSIPAPAPSNESGEHSITSMPPAPVVPAEASPLKRGTAPKVAARRVSNGRDGHDGHDGHDGIEREAVLIAKVIQLLHSSS